MYLTIKNQVSDNTFGDRKRGGIMTVLWADSRISKTDIQTIQVNLGNKCNQRCSHCHIGASPNGKKNMEKSVAKKLEDVFKKAGTAPAVINLAKKLMVYTDKPLYGDDLTAALAQRDKTFKNLAKEFGMGQK